MGRFIERSIRSVLNQTFDDLELIVVDDCSTDDSVSVTRNIASIDSRVRLLLNEHNRGTAFACNMGIKAAKGDFLCILGSDDIFEIHRIEKLVDALKKKPETIGLTDMFKIDEQDKVLVNSTVKRPFPSDGDVYAWFMSHGFPGFGTIMAPMPAIREVGLFDVTLKKGEDLDYALRLAEKFKFALIPEPLYGIRIHPGRKTTRIRVAEQERLDTLILESHLRRNWRLFDDDVRFVVIRRIVASALASRDIKRLLTWASNPTFLMVSARKVLRRIPVMSSA